MPNSNLSPALFGLRDSGLKRVGADTVVALNSATNKISASITIESGANLLVAGYILGRNSSVTFTSATYNSVAMASRVANLDLYSGSANYAGTGIVTLDTLPAAGTPHTLQINFGSNFDQCVMRVSQFSGVTSLGPVLSVVAPDEGSGDGVHAAPQDSRSGNITTTRKSIIIGCMGVSRVGAGKSFTPDAGVTELYDTQTNSLAAFFGERQEAAAGTFDFGATCSAGAAAALAALAVY